MLKRHLCCQLKQYYEKEKHSTDFPYLIKFLLRNNLKPEKTLLWWPALQIYFFQCFTAQGLSKENKRSQFKLITFLFISYDFEITVDINGSTELMYWSKSMSGTENSLCSPDTVISTSRWNFIAVKETENFHLVFYMSQ